MILTIIIIVAMIGAPALAVYSVYRRTKNTNSSTAGYIYNGKEWVAWLLVLSILSSAFFGFIMPLFDGQDGYHPEWGTLGLMALAIVLYICYAIIAFVPATAQEIRDNQAEGKTVIDSVAASAASIFSIILTAIGAILLALPGMISEALNPTLAIKNIGGTMYRIIGTGFEHAVGGIMGLALVAILAFVIIFFAAAIFAILGTFGIGILAIIKFVKNNGDLFGR